MLFYGRITFLLFLSTTVHLKFQLFYNFFSQDQGSVPSLDFFYGVRNTPQQNIIKIVLTAVISFYF